MPGKYLATVDTELQFITELSSDYGPAWQPLIERAKEEIDLYPEGRPRLQKAFRFAYLLQKSGNSDACREFYNLFKSHWLPEMPTHEWPAIDAAIRQYLLFPDPHLILYLFEFSRLT